MHVQLEQLLVHAHVDEAVPDAWVAAHAPDGSLEALWARCDHVGILMDLAALTVDQATLVRAACACARLVVEHLPAERRTEAEAALDTAERWARGEADLDAIAEAADGVDHSYVNVEPVVPLVSCAACAVDGAVSSAAAGAGRETRWYDDRQGKEAANHAATFAAAAIDWADPNGSHAGGREERSDVCPSLAAVLRAHLSCPTLDGVRRGIEDLREGDDAF